MTGTMHIELGPSDTTTPWDRPEDSQFERYVRPSRFMKTLARVPLFASLGPDDLRALDTRCAWRHVSARDGLFNDPPNGTDVYFVVSGHVRGVILSSRREMIIRDFRDGESFGAASAIDGRPTACGLRAVTDTVLARMKAVVFREAIDRYPSVRDGVLMGLAEVSHMLVDRINEHAQLHVRERLCAELLRLSRTTAKGRIVVSPPPTHAELASRINTHREAVTRSLKALEIEGAITRTRSAIELINPEHLRRMIARHAEHSAA
jgi:CRP/FNR family transcriptional regulator, cyclic AMP receptor protein